MIYSPDDVRKMLATLKQLPRYAPELYYSGCSDPECCGDSGTAVCEPDSTGDYVQHDELLEAIRTIEDSL